MGRTLSWECDNCGTKASTNEFPTTWIHLKFMWIAEGVCYFGRPSILSPDKLEKYRREFDKTFCSKECFLKYMAKIVNSNSDSSFNPSMKI
jgi:hypothetical protein